MPAMAFVDDVKEHVGRVGAVREIAEVVNLCGAPHKLTTSACASCRTAAEDLLEVIMRRYERASTLLTSNRPVDDWGKLLGDTAAVTALLDRLLHHAHVLKCGPRSWPDESADRFAHRRGDEVELSGLGRPGNCRFCPVHKLPVFSCPPRLHSCKYRRLRARHLTRGQQSVAATVANGKGTCGNCPEIVTGALGSGPRGRRFKSFRPDQSIPENTVRKGPGNRAFCLYWRCCRDVSRRPLRSTWFILPQTAYALSSPHGGQL
jgi:IstB-like ATP binding protein